MEQSKRIEALEKRVAELEEKAAAATTTGNKKLVKHYKRRDETRRVRGTVIYR